jgi:branched-chain amino acid aminotransferase
MVNFNGVLIEDESTESFANRSFLYGDGIFETFKICDNKILFFEDHYFRLMASMRIVRMEIPMQYTMEYLEDQILKTAKVNNFAESSRVRLTVFRNYGGRYLPNSNQVSFIIQSESLAQKAYSINSGHYEVDLYKDFHIAKHLLSTLKTTSKIIHVVGSIFAKENGLQNCLLLNEDKNVVEALQGNLFLLSGSTLITPPTYDGCQNGILRKNLLQICRDLNDIEVQEKSISPFELQKADELFITNVIQGIQPISKYRKKEFESSLASTLVEKLNNRIFSL